MYCTRTPDRRCTTPGSQVRRVVSATTRTLACFDNLPAVLRNRQTHGRVHATHHYLIIDVGTEVGAEWLLPVAYECCTRLGPEAIINGCTHRDDGTRYELSQEAQRKCILALRVIERRANQRISEMFLSPNAACIHPTICNAARNAFAVTLLKKKTTVVHHLPGVLWVSVRKTLCKTCYSYAQVSDEDWGEAYWEDMPERYGLPPWDELDKRREEDIGTD